MEEQAFKNVKIKKCKINTAIITWKNVLNKDTL